MSEPPRTFPDHFSAIARDYARFRPGYPDALFDWVVDLVPGVRAAWDAGTGTGQAAVGLARRVPLVVASDPSTSQLAAAERHPRVHYVQALAEEMPLASQSLELVTAAQALHWFDLDRFYSEVARILAPGGVLAVWSYRLVEVDARIDPLLWGFYNGVLGPYWPPERVHVDRSYRDLAFPFDEIAAPTLSLEHRWTFSELLGYVATWSAVRRCREATGVDPMTGLAQRIEPLWGNPAARRLVRWPLSLRAGRKAA